MSGLLPDWPQVRAVRQQVVFRRAPEDFLVDEDLGFTPQPDGEHVWLRVCKRGLNTEQVASRIAGHAGVPKRQVSWSGLKDRHAVTTQWFSVHLPGKGMDQAGDWQLGVESGELEVLELGRFARKLKRGSHRRNLFRIRLLDVAERDAAEAALRWLQANGAPNYFGEQRFGYGGSNLQSPDGQRESRFQRSMRLSAWRACVFNDVLARRVEDGTWNLPLAGDAIQFEGSGSWYALPAVDAETSGRVAALDAHPTGPLWGRGSPAVAGAALELEQRVAAGHPDWCAALEQAGMKQERRPLRLVSGNLSWRWLDNALLISFSLPRGCYATTLLSAVFRLQSQQGVGASVQSVCEEVR